MPVQLIALLFLAGLSLLLFFPLNARQLENKLYRKSRFDPHIPLVPAFIVPYLGLFPYATFAILTTLYFTPVAARFYVSCIFAGLVAAIIWYFFPSGVEKRPEFEVKGPLTKVVAWVYAFDGRNNALPSSHVFTAFLSSYYLTFIYPSYETAIWVTGTTIMGSTLFVKQHHFIDVVAGLALALAAIGASYFLLGALA